MEVKKMAKIKTLIVDDHQIVREGLRTYLDLWEEIEVVGEAESGADAITQVRRHQPDVVLMDLVMPGMGGIEATRQINDINPMIKVVVLTSFTEDEMVFAAIQAGAAGYLLKDVSPPELAQAIQAVHKGDSHLHPDITKKLMNQFVHPPVKSEPAPGELTPREQEVLICIAQGLSNRELAQKLTISEKTVKSHVSHILSKLHLSDRTQAAIYAYKNGLVPD
jgi:NarL family two-component system response regulator LiaR